MWQKINEVCQLVQNGNFESSSGWYAYQHYNITFSIANNKITITSNYSGAGGDAIMIYATIPSTIVGHKYLYMLDFNIVIGENITVPIVECVNTPSLTTLNLISENKYGAIVTATREIVRIYIKVAGTKAVGDQWEFSNVQFIDLTEMYGTGNEPTSVAEFRQSYPNEYYPYANKCYVKMGKWEYKDTSAYLPINKLKIKSPRLPQEYQEVEYIESSGTQWIDTGIVPSLTMGMYVKSEFINSNRCQFGCLTTITSSIARCHWGYDGLGYIYAYFGTETGSDIRMQTTSGITEARIQNGIMTITQNEQSISRTNNGYYPTNSIYLGAINFNGSANQNLSNSKIYIAKFYDNNTLVRNFIPCYRISDNTIGMYDLVNNEFYTNQGTGTFIKGNDVYYNLK